MIERNKRIKDPLTYKPRTSKYSPNLPWLDVVKFVIKELKEYGQEPGLVDLTDALVNEFGLDYSTLFERDEHGEIKLHYYIRFCMYDARDYFGLTMGKAARYLTNKGEEFYNVKDDLNNFTDFLFWWMQY
ncbi:MAG: hypothetical protein ACFFDF_20635 [Candidatus Odinarchaeota archaeon]